MLTTLKKPLNALDNPVYADIRAPAPRFYDSGKHWKVDTGKTMSQVEFLPSYQEHATLAQSRTYNTDIYGKKSEKDVVNKAFRPPLITLEDILPLNRLPREAVVPRTNPSSNEYQLMPRDTEIMTEFTTDQEQHFTTEKVKHGYTFPTYYRPINLRSIEPGEGIGGVVPDLKLKVHVAKSISSGIKTKVGSNIGGNFKENFIMIPQAKILDKNYISVSSGSSMKNLGTPTGDIPQSLKDLPSRDYTSISSGSSMKMFSKPSETSESQKVSNKKQQYSSTSSGSTLKMEKMEPIEYILNEKTHLKGIRTNKSVKMDNLNRKIFFSFDDNTKLGRDTAKVPMNTPLKSNFKSDNNYKQPDFKTKVSPQKGNYYNTQGYIPGKRPPLGETVRL